MLAACSSKPPFIPTHGPAATPQQAKEFCLSHPEDLLCKRR